MKVITLATIVALTGLATAQISKIPSCALPCFTKAIQETNCGFNTYCQCTTGAKVIQPAVVKCLCETNACSAADLLQLEKASNVACSSALAASSKTYTPATLPTNACGTKGGSTTTGSAASAITTGATTGTGTNTAASAASSSAASSTSGTGAAPTNAALLGYECAALGLAGMAFFGL